MLLNNFQQILAAAKNLPKKRVVVALAQDDDVIEAVLRANKDGLADFSLVGDKKKIYDIAEKLNGDISGCDIIKEMDYEKSIRAAVDMVSSGYAHILMKGMVQTPDLLRVVLEKESGLRTGGILSHLSILEVPNYHKMIIITDGGLNISPDIKQKAGIVQNAVEVAHALGNEMPKVAVLAAIELVNPAMQATIDAALLSKMAERGQIKKCIIDGPLAMDNAISKIAAQHKGIKSDVAGDADILLVPEINSGNILYKTLAFIAQAKSCGLVAGAKVPIVVTSRADSYETKLLSIAVASILQNKQV